MIAMLPPETWPTTARWAAVAAATVGGVATIVVMGRAGRVMRARGGDGIVAFELAGTPRRAAAIKRAWGADGIAAARSSLLVDFAFIAAYVTIPAVVAGTLAETMRERQWTIWADVATVSGWAFVAAGVLDLVENALLLVVLKSGSPSTVVTRGAAVCARVKFGLLMLAPFAIVTAGVAVVAG